MEVTQKARRRIRLQNILFYALFLAVIGVLAWLSTRYSVEADWTASGRNTPSEASIELVQTIEGPISITAFVTSASEPLRKEIQRLVGRYQRYKDNITLTFVNPDTEPALVREKNIMMDGELVVEYEGRSENVQNLTEEALTNALQRLVRSGERWVVFVQGHGERDPQGSGRHDLRQWSRQLESKGLKVRNLNLSTNPQIPENTSVLVIASPQNDWLPGEVKLLRDYLEGGGNLLWLTEPGAERGLRPVAEQLGLELLPGTVVDPNTQLLGISDPRFAIVAEYPMHPITRDFDLLTLYPQARPLEFRQDNTPWEARAVLQTLPRTWSETGQLAGAVEQDPEDIPGPLVIGFALERSPGDDATQEPEAATEQRQRVVVVGDGDFLSDAFLGQGGNLDMGLNMVNWLAHDDTLIAIPAKTAPDRNLELSRTQQAIIGFGFLAVLPLALLGAGVRVWLVRRRR